MNYLNIFSIIGLIIAALIVIYLFLLTAKMGEGHFKKIYLFFAMFASFIMLSRVAHVAMSVFGFSNEPWEFIMYISVIIAFLALTVSSYEAYKASSALGFVKSAYVKNLGIISTEKSIESFFAPKKSYKKKK